jgi:folate-dependent phosphoribosylglycinamide formyltransferase PurN
VNSTGGKPSDVVSRPFRVVLFSDPFLAASADELVLRLCAHESIDLLAVICEGSKGGARGRARDLWNRRGSLGLLIALVEVLGVVRRAVSEPKRHLRRRKALATVQLVPDLHSRDVIERVRRLAPDLGLIYGGPILKPELFEIPRLGTLGIHHGRLPEYRGKKTTFWEMYHGEPEAGVTIQLVNAGIDTGRVVAQAAIPTGRKGYGRVWRDVQDAGVNLYVDAILAVAAGDARPVEMSGKPGRLYKDPSPRQLIELGLRRLSRRRAPSMRSRGWWR